MEQIGVIPEQISQYMQNQAKIPSVPGGQVPNIPNFNPAMLGGGMLPGSNPMDLLQLQQFYQMQQMQMQQMQQPKKWSLYKDICPNFILWIALFEEIDPNLEEMR